MSDPVRSDTTRCPSCEGRGTVRAFVDNELGGWYDPALRCSLCRGDGVISARVAVWLKVGEAHRRGRIDRMESLRECAVRLGMTPSELSAMEHGRADPARIANG